MHADNAFVTFPAPVGIGQASHPGRLKERRFLVDERDESDGPPGGVAWRTAWRQGKQARA